MPSYLVPTAIKERFVPVSNPKQLPYKPARVCQRHKCWFMKELTALWGRLKKEGKRQEGKPPPRWGSRSCPARWKMSGDLRASCEWSSCFLLPSSLPLGIPTSLLAKDAFVDLVPCLLCFYPVSRTHPGHWRAALARSQGHSHKLNILASSSNYGTAAAVLI